ncbi:hypothetical protein R0J87_18435, partial [Halomonas sp. SIMBA_159]
MLEQPFRGQRKVRSVLALMTQMQHPASGRFVKVTPLRQKPEAKHDLLVLMSRQEPVPEPSDTVRMKRKNLYQPKLWEGLDTGGVVFPNHGVDSRGYVWRVTLPLSLGGAKDAREVPRDELAEMLAPEQWVRCAVQARETEHMAPRFVVQLRPRTGKRAALTVDVLKL